MSDWVGSGSSSGRMRVPAVFHGTARLLDGSEPPSPPRTPRFDDLPAEFQADLDVSYALLTGVGFEPVHPDHPAHARYLAASAAHAVALPSEPLPGPDPLSPDTISMPFETTITVTAEMALRHGLVPPGHPDSARAHEAAAATRPVRRKPVPPPFWRASDVGVGAVPSGGDIGAFTASLDHARRGQSTTATGSRQSVPASPLSGVVASVAPPATTDPARKPIAGGTTGRTEQPAIGTRLVNGVRFVSRALNADEESSTAALKQIATGTAHALGDAGRYVYHLARNGSGDPLVAQANAYAVTMARKVTATVSNAVQHPVATAMAIGEGVKGRAEQLITEARSADAAGTLPELIGGAAGEAAVTMAQTVLAPETKVATAMADVVRATEVGAEGERLAAVATTFETTRAVAVTGTKASGDMANSYEAGIRGLNKGAPLADRQYEVFVDGKWVNGTADDVILVGGKRTAIEAKFVKNWATSIRNSTSPVGSKSWSPKEEATMLQQVKKYSAGFPSGVIYHTNSTGLAEHYTEFFKRAGITNFRFVITPVE